MDSRLTGLWVDQLEGILKAIQMPKEQLAERCRLDVDKVAEIFATRSCTWRSVRQILASLGPDMDSLMDFRGPAPERLMKLKAGAAQGVEAGSKAIEARAASGPAVMGNLAVASADEGPGPEPGGPGGKAGKAEAAKAEDGGPEAAEAEAGADGLG
jgi:hypothetical protein